MGRIFIIAEAGVNHGGSLDTAKRMVDAAKKAGADAVKFQTFKAESMVSRYAAKADYQKKATGKARSQLEMLKKLELGPGEHRALAGYCRVKGIMFMSAPFDADSIDLLSDMALKIFKIPSGEITNLPYLRKIGGLGKRVILSTGMSDMKEVASALGILIKEGTRRSDITVLQCNSGYPTPYRDANLLAMLAMKDALGVDTGYSDHTPGIEVAIAAAALGASVIEKHFTLDKNMPGPDHRSSLEPDELSAMVRAIRNIEKALGSGVKRPSVSELKNRAVIRKSVVASRDINAGEFFSADNITVKRPGTGISPMAWAGVIGKKAPRSYRKDAVIKL